MIDGPYADDLEIGTPLPAAPSITIDEGIAAQYQAIAGDPARLSLGAELSFEVTGSRTRPVNSALIMHVVIGQSTVATRIVIANLFYRGVRLHRQPVLGDTITTVVTPAARAYTSSAENRRGKVLLAIEARDQLGRLVVTMERLALLPLRDAGALAPVGDVGGPLALDLVDFLPLIPANWELAAHPHESAPRIGSGVLDPMRDTISNALGLVRLTQNQAAAHRDAERGQRGRRLVYGGHVVGLAQASLFRVHPAAVTVLGWRGCDHLAPAFEDDLLEFETHVEEVLPVEGGFLVGARVTARAHRPEKNPVDLLDFRPVVLMSAGPDGDAASDAPQTSREGMDR